MSVEKRKGSSNTYTPNESASKTQCPRCGMDDAEDIWDGRCRECQVAEDEADWMDEDEAEGGSPWGR